LVDKVFHGANHGGYDQSRRFGEYKITFKYDPVYVARIKTILGRKWHPDGKYWTFPYSKMVFNQINSAFAGEKTDIDPSLADLMPKATAGHRVDQPANPLFGKVRDLIRLKHYSIRTEKSYLPRMERYLLFHHNKDPKEMGIEWAS
jgi:hypothetical protein